MNRLFSTPIIIIIFLINMCFAINTSFAQDQTINGNITAGTSGTWWQGYKSTAPTGTWGFQQNNIMAIGIGGNVYNRGLSTNAMGIMNGLTSKEDIFLCNQNDPSGDIFVLKNNGNVGVGTVNPVNKLDVFGSLVFGTGASDTYINFRGFNGSLSQIHNDSGLSFNYNGLTLTNNVNGANNLSSWVVDIGGADNITYHNGDSYTIRRNNAECLRVNSGGNVGIGTTAPDQKLSVAGTIHSQAVKVDMTGWSDYVFKPTYDLSPLENVKAYIDKNHHLPDMPSENEVVKNGVDLGEMLKLQQKKIEELTLYLIEMKNENTALTKRINNLEKSR